jgi:phosphoserine phosphatase
MSGPQITLLVTLTGRDRPGVTSRLFSVLSGHELAVVDVEQVVIRGRLVLGVLLSCESAPDLTSIHHQIATLADDMGMEAEITMGSGEPPQRVRGRLHVTVLGRPLLPYAIEVSGADPVTLRAVLARESVELGVDVAVQRAGLHRQAMRLVVMDVDSTLLQDEAIDLLAARAGCAAQVREITAAAMRGELDFAESLHQRVALLDGLDASVLDEVLAALRLAPGARTLIRTLKRLGYRCGVVSGGFTQFTDWLTTELGLDFAEANTLEVVAGKLTGRVVGQVVDRAGKERALRHFASAAGVPLSQTVAVGDGANDLDMISAAGLGIAFNAKPAVRDAADTSLSVPHLDAILYLLGISRDDVEAADAEDPSMVASALGPGGVQD